MRCVVQRVTSACVRVAGEEVGAIGLGFLVLLGVEEGDAETDLRYCAEKVAGLRVFDDDEGKMNLALADVGGAALVVSQFTLHGDVRKGRRPSFIRAARPEPAQAMVEAFCGILRAMHIPVATGVFQAHMEVSLVNDGPVTILIDSRRGF